MNKQFFINNREKYLNLVESDAVTILSSGFTQYKTADQEHEFVVNNNFYYFTGVDQDNVTLFLARVDGKRKEYLFIDENDETLTKWVGRKLTKEEVSELSGVAIDNVLYNSELDTQLNQVFQMSRKSWGVFTKCYLDLEQRNLKYFTNFGLETSKWLREKFPAIIIKNAYQPIISLRAIKNDVEVELIKQSLDTTRLGIEAMLKQSKPGIHEYELKSHFDFALSKANKRHSFDLIAASGINAVTLHYVKNDDVLKDGDLILFDLGCYTNHYASDISRTFPVNGTFTKRQKEVYEAVLRVNKQCIEFVKEGITWSELNQYAKGLLAKECIQLGLIKDEAFVSQYYYHSVSHSLGLDVHDPALYTDKIMAGVVLTIEPGLYIAEEGIGVRIEDNILVTKDGRINLSKDIVKEVKDIERLMAK